MPGHLQTTPLFAYRRGRNLSQMLTNKRLPPSDSSDPLYFTINNDTPYPLETACKICGRSFHTSRNLKIHFSHKHKHQTQAQCSSPGFWPCRGDSRCACYKTFGKLTRTVTSTTTGETFILVGHTTRQTSNVIYLIEYNKCNDQYIDETKNPVHRRTNQHRSDINGGQKNIPTVRHFINCRVKHLKLTVIEKVRNHNQDIRRAREKLLDFEI